MVGEHNVLRTISNEYQKNVGGEDFSGVYDAYEYSFSLGQSPKNTIAGISYERSLCVSEYNGAYTTQWVSE